MEVASGKRTIKKLTSKSLNPIHPPRIKENIGLLKNLMCPINNKKTDIPRPIKINKKVVIWDFLN